MVGITVQHFEILELIGRGAMGTVYKARDTRLDILRALKFLQPSLSDLSFAQAHLLREARTQAKLLHPNVAALLELEVTDEWTFLVLEYVDGPTLDVYLAESKPPLKERFNLIHQVACALDAAHSRDILHRDIKPKNIIIAPDGTAKVTDFGLAKALGQTMLTMSGETKGTAPYMAPEAFRGDKIGAAADVWSLGVLAYEALEDKLPFRGESFEAVAYQIVNEPHPPLSKKVEETLTGMSEFLDACLSKNEKERLADGSEAFLTLTGIATKAGLSSSIPALSIPRIHRRKRARLLRRRAALAVLGVAIIAGAILPRSLRGTRYVDTGLGWITKFGESSPSWNSRGDRIALIAGTDIMAPYIWEDPSYTNPTFERIRLDTELSFQTVSWSPNDSLLALSGDSGLYLYSMYSDSTPGLRQISEHSAKYPSWSSDSHWLVYWNPEGSDSNQGTLELIGPIGTDGTVPSSNKPGSPLVTGFENYDIQPNLFDPVYVLHDTHIAFRVTRSGEHLGVWVVPSSGGKAWKLIDGGLCPLCLNWDSMNRAILFYSKVQKRLYRQKLSRRGTKKGRERALDVSGNIASFDYHESTGQIALKTGMVRHNIWRIPPLTDGTPPTIVSTDFDANYSPMFSSNGERLFYAAYGCLSSMRLRVYNLTTDSDKNLFDNAPSISNELLPTPDPSDRYVVFRAVSEDTIDLYLYDSLRSDIKRLTHDVEEECDPIWTSDGMSIYYVWRPLNQDLPHEIRRSTFYFDQSSNQLKQIEGYEPVFTAPRLSYPIPDANGQYLLFQKDSHDESTICVLEPASGYIKSLKHGERPTLSPSRLDIYYHRDQCIYEIKNWPGAFERSEINEQLVFRIPQHLILWFRRPLAVGRDAAYAVLLEQNVGQLRVLKPDH